MTMTQLEVRRASPIEDLRDEISVVASKVSSGEAKLRITEYPWGLEFDLCDSAGGSR